MPLPFTMHDGRIIAVGASLGGLAVLRRLAHQLPADLAAPVVVVQHIGAHRSLLPELLSASGDLTSSHVVDGETLRPAHLHIAPPDHHVLIEGNLLRLTRGPKEHHTRPAVDPLFRSAALSHGANAIGVVLTGGLDDGTAGLQAINEAGGVAIVQDPAEAEDPSMPLSALRYARVDHCLKLDDMAPLLAELARDKRPVVAAPSMARWHEEHQVGLHQGDAVTHLEAIATPSAFVCPDCRGGLWRIAGSRPLRFLCHTGHSYTLRSLQHAQALATDEALWTAIRALQEKRMLLQRAVESLEAEGDLDQAKEARSALGPLTQQEQLLRDLVEELA